MCTYTDQHRYKQIQVLNKKTMCTNKVQGNIERNMQISHRHTQTQAHTVNEQKQLSKTLSFMLWKPVEFIYKTVPKL